MKAIILQFPFGVAAFGNQSQLVEKELFPKKPQTAAKSIMKVEAGKISDEIESLVTRLQNAGYDTFVFERGNIADEVQKRLGIKVETAAPSEAEALRSRMEEVAVET